MFENFKDVLTINEACTALSMGKNTLYKLIKLGRLKCIQVGKKYLIPKVCLIDFINKCR